MNLDVRLEILKMNFQPENSTKLLQNILLAFSKKNLKAKILRNQLHHFNRSTMEELFSNLMKILKEDSEASLIYPSCSIYSYEKFDEILWQVPVTVVTNTLAEKYESFSPMTTSQFIENLKNGNIKTQQIFVFFGETKKEDFSDNDKIIKELTDEVKANTNGDYVALYTCNKVEDIQVNSIGRELLNIQQIYPSNTTSNITDTWWVNETMYVDEQVLAGIIAMTVWLAIFFWGFCWLNCIWASDYIDDPFDQLASKIAKKKTMK